MALLLACALPLSAVNDIPQVETSSTEAAAATDVSTASSSEDLEGNNRVDSEDIRHPAAARATNDTTTAQLPLAETTPTTLQDATTDASTTIAAVGDDDSVSQHDLQDADFILAAQRLLEDESLTSLPNLLPQPLLVDD